MGGRRPGRRGRALTSAAGAARRRAGAPRGAAVCAALAGRSTVRSAPPWRALFDGRDTRDGLVLAELGVAVIGTDLCGTVQLWNAAAERLYGWTREQALGRSITALTVGPEDARVAERIMASVRARGSWEGEFWVRRHDGRRFLAYVRDVAVDDNHGRPLGLVGVSTELAPGDSAPAAAAPATQA